MKLHRKWRELRRSSVLKEMKKQEDRIMKPIVVRGGGDLATGVIHRLSKSGYSVIVLETDKPSAIRRLVAFSEAVENGSACVEGITCV